MREETNQFAEELKEVLIQNLPKLNAELQSNVSIMLDLKGPDLSVCKFTGGTAYLTEGTKIRIYEEEVNRIRISSS